MVINWYGQSCLKIVTKAAQETTVIIDPFERSVVGLNPPRGKADVVLTTHEHPDHNNASSFEGAFLIKGPGEHELREVFIKGILGWHDFKKSQPITMYRLESEGISLAHLSDLGQEALTDEQVEELGGVDILFVPIGGSYSLGKEKLSVLDAQTAQKVINQIEPSIVIPIHYKLEGVSIDMDGPEKFLKAMGASKPEELDKLTIKKKDINPEETKVIVLKAGSS
ncbi:lactamase [Candidatus Parcubacteria bacterium]|nr:MAG: lactamase [Candidatus Parcubacteria bacterium]